MINSDCSNGCHWLLEKDKSTFLMFFFVVYESFFECLDRNSISHNAKALFIIEKKIDRKSVLQTGWKW